MDTIKNLEFVKNPLFYSGDKSLLTSPKTPRVAVIGARRTTLEVVKATEEVSQFLCDAGVVIISGLAVGVDTIAAKTALKNGCHTVAIPGSPLGNIHPRCNQGLAKEIVEAGGLIATPFSPGTEIRVGLFPKRNRIIAQVVDCVVITGIAAMSGTFHVVWEAMKLEVPVFAIPPQSTKTHLYGANILIEKGHARPLDDFNDILKELAVRGKG